MTEPITIEAFDSSSSCRNNCTTPRCGDATLDGAEVCDDGNRVSGDGCRLDCLGKGSVEIIQTESPTAMEFQAATDGSLRLVCVGCGPVVDAAGYRVRNIFNFGDKDPEPVLTGPPALPGFPAG